MKFWIQHPEVDAAPVSFWRWACWHYAGFLMKITCRLARHQDRMERLALYGPSENDGDDIPF